MAEQVVVTSNTVTTVNRNIPTVPLSLVDLGKRLLDASKRGDTMEIRSLMSSGAPFTTDWLGTSPLHFASMHGHLDTVTILLRAGISRDARTKVDRTPLHVAAQNGHFEVVQILLKHSAIIDSCDMLKMTPLHWAVENGHTNVVNLLLKHDASTQHIDKFDRTPMDIAVNRMQMDIVDLLQAATNGQTGPLSSQDMVIEEEVLTTENPEQVLSTDHSRVKQTADTVMESENITDTNNSAELFAQNSSVGGGGGGGGDGNTSVLEALAELAASTAASSNDTASWLSSRGLSIANSDSDTPLALTEAGKLALTNFMKDQGVAADSSTVMTLVDQDGNQVLLVQQSGETNSTEESIAEETTGEMVETTTTDLHIDTNKETDELIIQNVE